MSPADEKLWKVGRRRFWSESMLEKFVAITSGLLELGVFFAAGGCLVVGMLLFR